MKYGMVGPRRVATQAAILANEKRRIKLIDTFYLGLGALLPKRSIAMHMQLTTTQCYQTATPSVIR